MKGSCQETSSKKLRGVIPSRQYQHLEVISIGRRVVLDGLQRMQNATMLWVGGEGRKTFRINDSQERLGWLDIGQVAAKASILAPLKVIQETQQGSLQEKIIKRDKKGLGRVKQCQRMN